MGNDRPPIARTEATVELAPDEPLVAGRYQLGELLGRGGMGSVYRARHVELGRDVAVKLIGRGVPEPRLIARFERELRVAAAIRHENVVSVTDGGRDEHVGPFLVMELLEGEALADRLTRGGLHLDESLAILDQVLCGLEAVHAAGVLHRDLKPQNVFLCSRAQGPPRVKLLDFGVSKLFGESNEETLTREGDVIGTPQYMSPEQLLGLVDIDARADVYAASVMLFRMLTGKLPFGRTRPDGALALEGLFGAPPSIRDERPALSRELDEVVTRGLARRREERFASAHEMREALREAAVSMGGIATPLPSLPPPEPSDARTAVARPSSGAPRVSSAPGLVGETPEAAGRDGVSSDGVSSDGVSSDGVSSDGVSSDGVSSDGVSSDGVSSDGVSSDGASSVSSDGVVDSRESVRRAHPDGGEASSSAVQAPEGPARAGSERRGGDERVPSRSARWVIALVLAALGVGAVWVGWPSDAATLAETGAVENPAAVEEHSAVEERSAVEAPAPPLRLGFVRYLPDEVVELHHAPLVAHLERTLGAPVELSVHADYVDTGRRLAEGALDVAALSAYALALARRNHPELALLARAVNQGGDSYQGVILARADDAAIRTLADLRGRVVCFVGQRSSSGYLFPRALLRRAGVDPDADLRASRLTGDHLSALRALEAGGCDAATIYASLLYDADAHGLSPQRFRILASTDAIPFDTYVAGEHVDAALRARLVEVLLALAPGSELAESVFGDSVGDLRAFLPASAEDLAAIDALVDLLDR
ncbi:MAG: PhnD/SsuA/transferrin family substrate-binding protein [Myxococcales bacterium]|nr:PhnD/SsuA/transferrin family substrate-binding protein [Myxococcales bacterium]